MQINDHEVQYKYILIHCFGTFKIDRVKYIHMFWHFILLQIQFAELNTFTKMALQENNQINCKLME